MLTLTSSQSNLLITLLPMQILLDLQYEVVDENTIILPEDFLSDDQFKVLCVLFAKENFTCAEVDLASLVAKQGIDFDTIKPYMRWKGLLHINEQDGTITFINASYRPSEYIEQKELALTRKADAEVERFTTTAKLELKKHTMQEKGTQTEPELSTEATNGGIKHKSVQPMVMNDEKSLPKSRKRKIQSTFSIDSLLGLHDTQSPLIQPPASKPPVSWNQRNYASLFQQAFTNGLTAEMIAKRYSELTAEPQSKGLPKPRKKQPKEGTFVKPKEINSVSSPHSSDLIVVDAPHMGLVPAFEFAKVVTKEIPSEEINSDIFMQARSGSDSNSQPVEDPGLTVMDKEEFAIYQNQNLKNIPKLFSQPSQLSGARNKVIGRGKIDETTNVRKMA